MVLRTKMAAVSLLRNVTYMVALVTTYLRKAVTTEKVGRFLMLSMKSGPRVPRAVLGWLTRWSRGRLRHPIKVKRRHPRGQRLTSFD